MVNSDQHFLLLFIMGTYFAPDLYDENPKKPALQRLSEGLPPYTSEQLANTKMKTLLVEQVYYHVLRRANKSLVVTLPIFRQFFQGLLLTPPCDPNSDQYQFPDLFPIHLHPHARVRDRYKTIDSIVFINNPDIAYINAEDIGRFKRLTGLENLVLDRTAVMKECVGAMTKQSKARCSPSVPRRAVSCFDIGSSSGGSSRRRKRSTEMHVGTPPAKLKPVILILPDNPTDKEWSNLVGATSSWIELSGTIAERPGPLVGLVDIGVHEDSYFFRVSLPGVVRNEKDFECTIDSDGLVTIFGQTKTGEKNVVMNEKTYEMQTQNLCPAGPFTISFRLPGPVKIRNLDANFEDGMLQGVVMKKIA